MNSMKMKTLSLAVLGLAGFVGSAFAQTCPTDPAQPNGPWSSKTVASDSTLTISTPGLNGTSCLMAVTTLTGALSNTKAIVSDTSPVDEPRYRARFYFDVSALAGLTLSNQQAKLFDTFSNASPGGASTDEVVIRLLGGTPLALRFAVADSTQPSFFKTITQALPASANGHYYVEFDLVTGATAGSGNFRYWVTPEGTASSDGTPTGTFVPGDNSGWGPGPTQSNLGIFSVSANYRAGVANQILGVDEFDSRRSTFIGQ